MTNYIKGSIPKLLHANWSPILQIYAKGLEWRIEDHRDIEFDEPMVDDPVIEVDNFGDLPATSLITFLRFFTGIQVEKFLRCR